MSIVPFLLELPGNRARRNYRGGFMLDRFEGKPNPVDTDRPEDWIASTVAARNPGLDPIENEGLATVAAPDGSTVLLRELFAQHPETYLGAAHTAVLGTDLGFLFKLLDASMRLHVQAHPTAAFAQEHLNSQWGKLETYVILDVRPDCTEPYIRLGFQHAVGASEWRRIVLDQDIAAMDACFEKVPVNVGEVWVVPGGLPHAIGEGLLVIEVMEPTDLVVRCEFEREGLVVPPQARFMQRDPDFALQIFDHAEQSVEQIRERCRVKPESVQDSEAVSISRLIGPRETGCFEVHRYVVRSHCSLATPSRVLVGLVTNGEGSISVGDTCIEVKRGTRFLVAAAARTVQSNPKGDAPLEMVICQPGNCKRNET